MMDQVHETITVKSACTLFGWKYVLAYVWYVTLYNKLFFMVRSSLLFKIDSVPWS